MRSSRIFIGVYVLTDMKLSVLFMVEAGALMVEAGAGRGGCQPGRAASCGLWPPRPPVPSPFEGRLAILPLCYLPGRGG